MSLGIGRRGTVLLAAAALTATAAGISWASIPDGSGQIHACYQKSTGLVRVIDSPSQQCRGGESPLNWSQGGPSAAPAGTAYEAYRELGGPGHPSDPVELPHDWTTLAHLDVPAGSYVATANVSMFNHSDAIYFAHCRVVMNGGHHSDAFDSIRGVQFGSQAMTVAGSLSSPGGVDLQCSNDSNFIDQPLEADGWDLTVVPVGGVTQSAQ
ncbi:hypothetical protein [Streptomyces sp. NRRL B-24484]|uniref:hypothetical protein n=1 Tax=Streptomyces sp. NRRL B-24484 TaxID=1463833 RepID=UPI0004BE7DC4|nr:hypothetical protein [Streptomyces sp. NRRL B-24484]